MTDEMRAAEIKKWQDGLFDAFRHNGVLGDRYFGPVLELEPLVGGVFVEKYFGHRVLTDSFMDFFGETLSKQGEFNSKNGWPQDRPYYVTCLMGQSRDSPVPPFICSDGRETAQRLTWL